MNFPFGFRPKSFHLWNQFFEWFANSKKISCCSVNLLSGLQPSITKCNLSLSYMVINIIQFIFIKFTKNNILVWFLE
jgi:hypothetical protein